MAKLTVCVSIVLVLLAVLGESNGMRFCCTEYQQQPVPLRALRDYRTQGITEDCNIKAVIFRTKRPGKFFCANPDKKWVQIAMEAVPEYKNV